MNRRYQHCLAGLVCLVFQPVASVSANMLSPSLPEQAAAIDAQEQIRQQQRERALQQQNAPDKDIRLTRPSAALPDYPTDESPCFPINTLRLEGESAPRFQWALKAAEGAKGRCLGSQGILLVINKVQNALLEKGYVTTRVMAQEQDLTHGQFTLTLQPGRIGRIHFVEPVSYRARLWNAMPARAGDILNLRDIEQALENFKRVSNVEADIKIVPGEKEATSDLQIVWQESRPFHLSLGLDDSGAKSTGKYQGSATLSIDAPFAQNDLFYVNVGRSLFRNGPYDSRSNTVNYTIPMGYWSFSANYNDYNYYQNIANANETLTYSGRSENTQLTVSRLLFRNQSHKTTLNVRAYRRHSTNAVDDIMLDQQQRRTAGWELGLNQRSYLGSATLDANLNWRRGTGAFGAIPAPEEAYNGGTSRPSMLMADASLNLPFQWATQPWRYNVSVRGQWSNDPLTPQDRLAIGGRYTVRGFDGEQSLSGEKGLIWRNELAWNVFARGHELYWGVDYGRVDGPGTRHLAGRQLAGSVLGVRGALWQRVSYDLFAGLPLYKPEAFSTSGVTAGFSINLQI
ncbi:ShlB/FhaC/HecB family hemolysin secretion/activation protein [Serratia sp. NPDC078593]|uniref:ShlB/FhaC/HecB family hemolysin secretion/activation protein n=1 Tax=unclassified Serratia (in: enterobacteria) TaxID=2647522 RepID=UPI0037D74A4A